MPHRSINYTGQIPSAHNGNKILSFSYSRSAGNLISDWSAELASGTYNAGDEFSISIMSKGIITNAYKDSDGKVVLNGKDAGVRLMRPCPPPALLPEGDANVVIADICDYCGVTLRISGAIVPLGFNARAAITATTCAEAVLELALLMGRIAYIANDGALELVIPSSTAPTLPVALSDSGTTLNTDGYATKVGVLLSRQSEKKEQSEEGTTYYRGATPGGSTTIESDSGTFSAAGVTGSWSVERINPLGLLKKSVCVITQAGVTTTFTEEHSYNIQTKTVWRGAQEFRLFAYLETGYSLVKKSEGSYAGKTGTKTFTETTTETMTRNTSIFNDPLAPEDWKSSIGRVDEETVQRTTVRTGGPAPDEGDPPYAPPFDEKIQRVYSRTGFGNNLVCIETRETYDKRTLMRSASVYENRSGERVKMNVNGIAKNLNTVLYSFNEWVLVKSTKTTIENCNEQGDVVFSVNAETSDDGAKDIIEKGWLFIGAQPVDALTEEYQKFTANTSGLSVSMGGGKMNTLWQFAEFDGCEKVITEGGLNSEEWYSNGGYIKSRLCPHFDAAGCRINDISTVPVMTGKRCPYSGVGWRSCHRAVAALEQARQEEENPPLEPPVYKEAGVDGVQYLHELTIEEILTTAEAEVIALRIAQNILRVKSTKGIVRTVAIPFDSGRTISGSVVGISHDLDGLTTSVSYLENRAIPLFLLPGAYTTAIIASGREQGRRDRPRIGTVASISGSTVFVRVGNVVIRCISKLSGVGVGDSVVVTMPAGTASFGIITDRL